MLSSALISLFFIGITDAFAKSEDYGSYLAFSYALNKGDIKGASPYIEKYLETHSDDMANLRKGYLVMGMAGNIEDATFYAKKDIGKGRMQVADLIIAIENADKGDYAGARSSMQKFANNNKSIEILTSFTQSWFYAAEKNYEKALEVLEKAKNQADLKSMYALHKGMIYEISGRDEKAIEYYNLALKTPNFISPRAMQMISKLMIKHDKENKVLDVINKLERNKSSTFMADYKNYITNPEIPTSLKTFNDGLSEAFFGMALLFFQAHSNEVAEMLYNFAIEFSPDFYSLRLMFGELYEEGGDYNNASKIYGQFDLETPFGFTALTKKALMMARKAEKEGDEEAKENAGKALKYMAFSYPEITLMMNYADFLREDKQFAVAGPIYTQLLDKVSEKDGKIPNKYWLLLFYRAICYERTGNWEKAEVDFLEALELSPDNPYILNYLGYSWLINDINREKAVGMIEAAYKQLPTDGHIADSLGWAYYLTGDYEKAQKILELALRLVPDNSVILDHLGDAYWKVGRKLEAEFMWKKALQLDKDFEPGDKEKVEYKLENGLDEFELNYEQD